MEIFLGSVFKTAFYVSRGTFLEKNIQKNYPTLIIFGFSVEHCRQDCQNCILRCQRNILRENYFQKNSILHSFFRDSSGKFLNYGEKISGLSMSKLTSTCPEEHFDDFWKNSVKCFPGHLAKSLRQVCQNCIFTCPEELLRLLKKSKHEHVHSGKSADKKIHTLGEWFLSYFITTKNNKMSGTVQVRPAQGAPNVNGDRLLSEMIFVDKNMVVPLLKVGLAQCRKISSDSSIIFSTWGTD